MGLFGPDEEDGVPLAEFGKGDVWARFAAHTRNAVRPVERRPEIVVPGMISAVRKFGRDMYTAWEGGTPPSPELAARMAARPTPPDGAAGVTEAGQAYVQRMQRAVRPENRQEVTVDAFLQDQKDALTLLPDIASGRATIHDPDFTKRLMNLIVFTATVAGPTARAGSALLTRLAPRLAARAAGGGELAAAARLTRSAESKAAVEATAPEDAISQTHLGASSSSGAGLPQSSPANTGASFPQYALQYPRVGPPEWKIDPITGRGYWAKKLLPDVEDFAAQRRAIMNDMRKNGYDGYFAVDERIPVDPLNYPPNVDTTTNVPKRASTIAKDMAQIGSPSARARIQSAYQYGVLNPNTVNWHALGQVEQEFIREYGPEVGRKQFADFITSWVAPTAGQDTRASLLMGQYGRYLRNNDVPWPTAAFEMPYPIGGRYAMQNMNIYKRIFDEGGWPALDARFPKRHDIAQQFMGNPDAAAIDERLTKLVTPGRSAPPRGKYGLYRRVYDAEGRLVGMDPSDFQDSVWNGSSHVGIGHNSGTPMDIPAIAEINEAIERTHRLTGMPKWEIVRRGIVRGEIPLYGTAGVAVIPPLRKNESSTDLDE